MLKKLALGAASLLIAANTFAMHLTVKAGDDIVANNDKINFTYDIYTSGAQAPDINLHDEHMEFEGMSLSNFAEYLGYFNTAYASTIPVDNTDGSHSRLTLGYKKTDGTIVTPASCQNIPAKMEMNLVMNETGCGEI